MNPTEHYGVLRIVGDAGGPADPSGPIGRAFALAELNARVAQSMFVGTIRRTRHYADANLAAAERLADHVGKQQDAWFALAAGTLAGCMAPVPYPGPRSGEASSNVVPLRPRG